MIKTRLIKWWMIAILYLGWGTEQLSAEDISRIYKARGFVSHLPPNYA
jgi:hypothetical protein